MKRTLFFVSAVLYFPLMVAVDAWWFRRHYDMSYVDWYIANGTLISVSASLFAVVWKNLNDVPDLIAADPRLFLSANMRLIGTQWVVTGQHLSEAGDKFRAHQPLDPSSGATSVPVGDLWDGLAALVATIVMVTAVVVWFITIVPLQYFIVLVAGAPSRLARKLRALDMNPAVGADATELEKLERNLLSAPVAMTNAFAALIILAIKLARSA